MVLSSCLEHRESSRGPRYECRNSAQAAAIILSFKFYCNYDRSLLSYNHHRHLLLLARKLKLIYRSMDRVNVSSNRQSQYFGG